MMMAGSSIDLPSNPGSAGYRLSGLEQVSYLPEPRFFSAAEWVCCKDEGRLFQNLGHHEHVGWKTPAEGRAGKAPGGPIPTSPPLT